MCLQCARQFYVEQWRSDAARSAESDAGSVSHGSEIDYPGSASPAQNRNNHGQQRHQAATASHQPGTGDVIGELKYYLF